LKINIYNYKNIEKNERRRKTKLLQKYVLMSFLLLMPPRRTNDYASLRAISSENYYKMKQFEKNSNLLVVVSENNKFLSYGEYKTSKLYGIQQIQIPDELNKILNLYLKYHSWYGHLFINNRQQAYSSNTMTRYIAALFKDTGKNITTTLIRHIYLSEKYPANLQEKMEDAYKMGHSVSVQQHHYIKA
jgi:hypothetical protein